MSAVEDNTMAELCPLPMKQETALQENGTVSITAPPKNDRVSLAAQQKDGAVTLAAPPTGELLQQQHKRRSKNWTRAETLRLIRLRADLEPRFARGGRKSELWDEISESLRRESICRDAQQCRDKWEKLTAGYKEVRDGLRHREDNPFFDELDPLLSVKAGKKPEVKDKELAPPVNDGSQNLAVAAAAESEDEETAEDEMKTPPLASRKRRKVGPTAEKAALRELLESLMSRQQRFFAELLDSMERKEQIREQIRQEKEDRWRAEERAQRCVFHNAMIVLTKKVLEAENTKLLENDGVKLLEAAEGLEASRSRGGIPPGDAAIFPKRRSKNWKRAEVLQLIKVRAEMESRFAQSTRRAALWEEVSELLASQGVNRDGKQCREKWDKLMAEYKDVCDGKRDKSESPYFVDLTAIVGRSGEAG